MPGSCFPQMVAVISWLVAVIPDLVAAIFWW